MTHLLANYRPRIIDSQLEAAVSAGGAVLIEGARACGKTATARRVAASEVNLETNTAARKAGLVDARTLLDGESPRLIDEWQFVPDVWGQVRSAVDDSAGLSTCFILTGSTSTSAAVRQHSGAARITRLHMRPMSLYESGRSSGEASLSALFDGGSIRTRESTLTVRDIADLVSTGGWPGLQHLPPAAALNRLRGYIDNTADIDLPNFDGVRRDPQRVKRVIQSLARNTAQTAKISALAADAGGSSSPFKPETVQEYLDALAGVFFREDLPAWAPVLMAKSRLRDAEKRHLVDPSLAVAALGTRPEQLVLQTDTLGHLFESLVVRDLRIYAQALDARVFHYLDGARLEVDTVVECRDGRWGAFEVKLGQRDIDAGADSVLRLAKRVSVERHGKPAFLGVITGWGYGYQRGDGVLVIPIGALAP